MNDLNFDCVFDLTDDFDPDGSARPRDAAAFYEPDVRRRDPDLRWADQDENEER